MYIKTIELKNVRGFSNVSLDLKRPDGSYAGWTVFAGQNGSGKTTLLRALALATYQDSLWPAPAAQWLKNGSVEGLIRVSLQPGKGDQEDPSKGQGLEYRLSWRTNQGSDPSGSSWSKSLNSAPRRPPRLRPDPFKYSKAGSGWLLLGYGSFRRLSGEAIGLENSSIAQDRVSTLFNEGATLQDSIRWLQDQNYKSLEEGPEKAASAALEKNVLRLLNDGLMPDGVQISKVSSRGLHVTQNNQELILDQLSDGFRSTLAMVLDIVRQLNNAFGCLDLRLEEDHCFVAHEGVILIDEMDAHLHISWQRKIGFWLKKHFPGIQFLVTTHSPFICQAADPKGLIHLPALGGHEQPAHLDENIFNTVVNGSVADASLSELFGLSYSHSDRANRMREELAQLEGKMMQNRISPEELKKHAQLVAQMPKDGGMEVIRAINQLREAWQ